MFCWYCQWKISKLADENYAVLSQDVSEHLKRCSACRQFYHLCRGMERRSEPLSFPPQATAEIQQKIVRRLHSESAVQMKHTASCRKIWVIAAILILLAYPAVVMWTTYADLGPAVEKETVDVGGSMRLFEAIQQRWMDGRTAAAPAEHYIIQSYQKQLQDMTRSGKQAAAFMFACLDPGLQTSEIPSEQKSVLSQ